MKLNSFKTKSFRKVKPNINISFEILSRPVAFPFFSFFIVCVSSLRVICFFRQELLHSTFLFDLAKSLMILLSLLR